MEKIVKFITNLLYPRKIKCVLCNRDIAVPNEYLCDGCKKHISVIQGKVCEFCGEQLNDLSNVCNNCKERKIEFVDVVRARFNYKGDIRKLIIKFKFKNEKWLEDFFSEELYKAYLQYYSNYKIDYVIPVPLSQKRLSKRGYNQSLLILNKFKENGFCVLDNVLQKNIDTPQQSTLTKVERLDNLKDCFIVENQEVLNGKTVLLVDDIFTTGATIEQTAKVLKKAHCTKVLGLVLAKNPIKLQFDK